MNRPQRSLQTLRKGIAELIDDDLIEKALTVLDDCLGATRTVRGERERGEPVSYVEVADYPVRMAAAKTLVEFRHGKAKQSINLSNDDAAGRQKGREEVLQAILMDWERTKRIGDTWMEGMKRAEKPTQVDVPTLIDVDID